MSLRSKYIIYHQLNEFVCRFNRDVMIKRVVIVCQLRRFLMLWAVVGNVCVCWIAVRTDAKTHMTEPKDSANDVVTAQRMRPANLWHKPLSNLRVCPQLPYKSQGHIPLPNTRTLHAVVTKEPLT
jgi:hypothetical protein